MLPITPYPNVRLLGVTLSFVLSAMHRDYYTTQDTACLPFVIRGWSQHCERIPEIQLGLHVPDRHPHTVVELSFRWIRQVNLCLADHLGGLLTPGQLSHQR